ncbi:uncharacterized protein LOC115791576 [Archocentrus centrarchus]|uniref:uncharacterized protein LOC115791576 n=1 Tax=Archocentrus centrarchus TaxID=63155 RepID=UPI0011EA0B17|nr:uncharacterized protein LOC115791576 [Archocentrus centrarchus]
MATGGRQRSGSKDLPPNLSELMNKLIEVAASFIQQFDNSEPRMREIVEKFQKISEQVKGMQLNTDQVRQIGAFIAAAATGVLVFAVPFTGGMSLAAGAAAGGVVAVFGANGTKMWSESGSAKEVEELGTEFMAMVEPVKKNLEEIKMTCEELERKSAEALAKNTLTDMEEFQRILRRVSELKQKSKGVLSSFLSVLNVIDKLLVIILSIIKVTASPEQDEKLRDAIIQSADQCQKVVNEFEEMKKELIDFTGKDGE